MPLPERHPLASIRPASILMAAALGAVLLVYIVGDNASAADILRPGAGTNNAKRPAAAAEEATAAAAAQARANAKDALARTTKAMNAAKAVQAAARNAAKASQVNNLGSDPNNPGAMLPNVPDGLVEGGLQVATGGVWTGADAPTESRTGTGVKVTVTQKQQQALLDWQTFNVGRNTNLHFDQTAGKADVGKWTAFNRITDPTGSPSQILGSITAAGQVYVINQNGIIFGGTSQVNTHILVASALPINEGLIARGLLSNPDAQFLFSALPQAAGTKGPTPAFTPPALPANGKIGDVTVMPGAQIVAPTTAANVGGRVVLVGANVSNSGTIFTPDGQTILAAGLQVGFEAHKSSDPSLRGLDAFVGAVRANDIDAEYAGTVTNNGVIDAPRASVIMTGKTINQLAVINSSTSTSLNGRIDLDASYDAIGNIGYDTVARPNLAPFLYRSTGTVTIGAGSMMQIIPEYDSLERTIGTVLALRSQVNVRGRAIYFGPQSSLLAPNATVSVNAGIWNFVSSTTNPSNPFVYSGGQIYVDQGAMINVAGSTDITLPLSQQILTVELRGAELSDSPLQRTGLLRGPKITVDLRKTGTYNGKTWVGTPLANLTGYVGLIERTVGELTVAGGSVQLNAGGSVVTQPGSIIDVSGGFVNYEGGMVATTRVLHGGRLFDIADAFPDRLYDGIYTGLFTETHARWGITKTYKVPWMTGEHYEMPYMHGSDAGTIALEAPGMALDGTLQGHTMEGPRQREVGAKSAELTLTFQKQEIVGTSYPYVSLSPPEITFGTGSLPSVGPFAVDEYGDPAELPEERKNLFFLSPDLFTKNGFGKVTVDNPDGDIIVPKNVTLEVEPGGSLRLYGANVLVEGVVNIPGGTVDLKAYNLSPSVVAAIRISAAPAAPAPNPDRGVVTLSTGAALNTAGLVIDDRLYAPAPLTKPLVTNGGSVSITAYSAVLEADSLIDVSGGALMDSWGKTTYGNGGSIVIKTGQDPSLLSLLGGKLQLDGVLKGYSGAKGGSLGIQAPLIQIGGTLPHPDALLLMPEFFRQGGFTNYILTGIGIAAVAPEIGAVEPDPDAVEPDPDTGVVAPAPTIHYTAVSVAPGVKVQPVAESLLAIPDSLGTDTLRMKTILKPVGIRQPTSISLNAPGIRDDFTQALIFRGDVVLGKGGSIVTDPLASVTLSGQTVSIYGTVSAPAGSIVVKGATSFPSLDSAPVSAYPTVFLAPGSVISAAGTVIYTPNRYGNRTGVVLPGGSIEVSGNIVAAAGALLNVSGTTGLLDIHPSYLGLDAQLDGPLAIPMIPASSGLTSPLYRSLAVPVQVDSDGGSIAFKGGQMLFIQSDLQGSAGGPTALGGSLSVSSGRFYLPNEVPEPDDINMVVTQDGDPAYIPVLPEDGKVIGVAMENAEGLVIPQLGYFQAGLFRSGGFDSLNIGGNIRFEGDVNIDARRELRVADGGILFADGDVTLSAPYVALGKVFQAPVPAEERLSPFLLAGAPFPVLPTYGPGRLTVRAELLDVGHLSLQNIGSTSLLVGTGDIRGNGTFDMAGELTIQAGQIYPTTGAEFTISSYDYAVEGVTMPGSVTITGGGATQFPMSAGGILNIYASEINQGGVLRAPIGQINLGWDGLNTAPKGLLTQAAVPVTQTLTLQPGSITSVAAVDPKTGLGVLLPYGLDVGGTNWIDPNGMDITTGGVPFKQIRLAASNLNAMPGSVIDLRGGGELFSYRWIEGNGGSTDILADAGRYAVIPGYSANFSPFNPFNTADEDLADDPGYANGSLGVGDRVYLGASPGLAAGVYTLLPARYALMPGAFLVTPQAGAPIGTFTNPDGSSYVAGYAFNDLNGSRQLQSTFSRFEVAPASTFLQRSQYEAFYANSFLKASAEAVDARLPRLPMDAGYLLFKATQGLQIDGDVFARGASGGRGGLIDISTPLDILINNSGTGGGDGVITLSSSRLSGFGAESLLIGGERTFGPDFTTVTVNAGNVTLDNAGAPLTGPEIILVANKNLTLAPGSIIRQSGYIPEADNLVLTGSLHLGNVGESLTFSRGGTAITFPSGTFGDNLVNSTVSGVINLANGTKQTFAANVAFAIPVGSSITLDGAGTLTFASGTGGSIPITMGDGVMVRVSGDFEARSSRSAVASSTQPHLVVGAGVILEGTSVSLDSTYATTLDPTAEILGDAINLASGQISILFDNPGVVQPTVGLVLSGTALQTLQEARFLSLLSYSTLDLYGTGMFTTEGRLELHAGAIRGFNQAGGTLEFLSNSLLIDNSANVPAPAAPGAASGTLRFTAETMEIGANPIRIDQYSLVELNAPGGLLLSGNGGLTAQDALTINTPLITAASSANQYLKAGGVLILQGALPGTADVEGGLGATVLIQGATVTVNTDITLTSGLLTLHSAGDLTVGGQLDVSGTMQPFNDLIKYTSGGEIKLISDTGSVTVAAGSILNVSAPAGGGDAGVVSVSAALGGLTLDGSLLGAAGAGGKTASFNLDVSTLSSLGDLNAVLNAAVFSESRIFRIRNTPSVLVDGLATSRIFRLTLDQGSITVTGTIDASGVTGGTIDLKASGSVVLASGAVLNASGTQFSNAGKGGAVFLEAGSQRNGVIDITGFVDIQAGSTIDLSVAANTAASASLGQFTGTLHLRAPQNATFNDVRVDTIEGSILNASSILVEGYRLFDLTPGAPGNAVITTTVQTNVRNNGIAFIGANGTPAAGYNAMYNRIMGANVDLAPVLVITAGAEIINRTGDLTLGTSTSTSTADWNLANLRFGPRNAAGVLTLRASGNLVFFNSLNDGFVNGTYTSVLLPYNPNAPVNTQSYSYRLASGADFTGVDFRNVRTLESLALTSGSILIGKNAGANAATTPGANATTASAIGASGNRFQVIRTGTGNIDLVAGRDVQILNQFSGVYTAGVQVEDPTMGGTFDVPIPSLLGYSTGTLGVRQIPDHLPTYSMAGGNVSITAQADIAHYTRNVAGALIDDSSREMPINWLYRRGYVDPATGLFGTSIYEEVASTTWWVDFTNFFEGVGALGGGDVTMIAGNDVKNVDAVIPTNARMAGRAADGTPIAPDENNLVELGGGDLLVKAGHNIDAGVYYVERGMGELVAGGAIMTNGTRSPSRGTLLSLTSPEVYTSETWLPTTLFLGKGAFDVTARGDVLLGPVTNPFFLPQAFNNTYWYKTYFNTYGADSAVNVSSYGGNVTLRNAATRPGPGTGTAQPMLRQWFQSQYQLTTNPQSSSFYQPWLRLSESNVQAFQTAFTLAPPTLKVTAFSKDINVVGNINLFPSATGTLELAAAGSISGLNPTGVTTLANGSRVVNWTAATINLSDTNPGAFPSLSSPFAYQTLVGIDSESAANTTQLNFMSFLDVMFNETGSYTGAAAVTQAKQALHAPGLLHGDDSEPVRIFASTGDISGLTLYSAKAAEIVAGNDIADVALYVQNNQETDTSIVAAGRDILPYSANTLTRTTAQSTGNVLGTGQVPMAGDIQISGPGTLEVLAGRDLNLGTGEVNADGTGAGITSIGNARNPSLPFEGADIIIGAGLGPVFNLSESNLDIEKFISEVLEGPMGTRYFAELEAISGGTTVSDVDELNKLEPEEKARITLQLFYLALRTAGRDFNLPDSAGVSAYDSGFAAIEALFPAPEDGDITTYSRDIRTKSGGSINIFAPGGGLQLGTSILGNPETPPGIVTEYGGGINVFTHNSVGVGVSRIFTLRGGDIMIWSSTGDIAAGSSAKTVASAPPTRVLIDPQSADISTDLAGLSTGGGIGVLATVKNVPPGDVDLIAPVGVVDAGDAGIRVTGNLNIAATAVLNARNIAVGGASVGTPSAPVVAAPNIGGLTAASSAAGAGTSAASEAMQSNQRPEEAPKDETPSVITVEVLGYGGGGESDADEDEERRRKQEAAAAAGEPVR